MAKYNSRTDAKLYSEVYKRNIQEAYRVLSSTNRLKPEYDKEFDGKYYAKIMVDEEL